MGITERKEREREQMRGLILKTAMRLFLREGFDKVTIRKIAEEIEYSPATIYLYFKDKNEVLFALHTEGFEELYRRQLTISSVNDPLKRLHRHGEVYLSFALENPEYYDLMFIMRGPGEKIVEEKEWGAGLRSYEFLRTNVRECMEAGLLPRVNLDAATFSFWSQVHGIAALIIRERCVMFPKEHLSAIVNGALDFRMGLIMKGNGPMNGKRRK
ncbi:MAG TPA: TetR/AcrR family transcriptional regulator [Thermodesulfovibrionales bacterium]|nr:TetR/AcrR family transcriptional regulator [Thermodesulfovibrionales bacterium]